jgi:hypothetical protein
MIVMPTRWIIHLASRLTKFFTNNIHIPRRFNANPNSVRADTDDRYRHVVTNQDLFAWLSREHQHTATPFMVL